MTRSSTTTKKPHKDTLVEASDKLHAYDAADLLRTVAGLQLLPRNSDQHIRLESLAHAIASLSPESGKATISRNRLKALCNGYPFGKGAIAAAEDPSENLFTEDFMFVGGSYLVFPGVVSEATFILRNITKGLFLFTEQFEDRYFLAKALSVISGVLALSNEVALRANLLRGMRPVPAFREDVFIPDAGSLRELKQAVSFTARDFADLLRRHGADYDDLEPLVAELGSVHLDNYSIGTGPLLPKPIVKTGEDVIAALPGMLLPAAWNELIRLALRRGVVSKLAARFNTSVWDGVNESLAFLEHTPLPVSLPKSKGIPDLRDGLFTIDTDKVMYVVLVTDALHDYDPKLPFGEWQHRGMNKKLVQRVLEVERLLLEEEGYINEVFFLLVYQGMGRSLAMPMIPPRVSPFLMMTAADLETISVLEAGDPLLLWKFAHAGTRLRRKTQVVAFSTLDEFNVYRAQGYSYYVSDDRKPDLLHFATDGALSLRAELVERRDFHGAPSYNDGFLTEVTTLHGTREVPIYIPKDNISHGRGEYVAVLVEGLPLPIWIISGRYSDEQDQALHSLYAQFSDAIAYWLWQFSEPIRDVVRPLASKHRHIQIQLRIEPDEAWHRIMKTSTNEDVPIVVVSNPSKARLTVTLRSELVGWLSGSDNRGERLLMSKVLQGLRGLLPEACAGKLEDSVISDILDRYAPLGRKKKLLMVNTALNPVLDPSELPKPRKVKLADENILLDELGEHLCATPGPEAVGIPDDERTIILQKVVAFYYNELRRLVGSLSPDSLLEHLIAQHEALLTEQALQDLLIPTKIECFKSETELAQDLQEEIPSLSKAALASRFVIEYVVAQPPSGIRPISLSVYDRLQAISTGIRDFGFESDLIHNKLADIKLSILPSGRIGADRDTYRNAMETYLSIFASGEIFRAKRSFEKHWEVFDSEPPDPEIDDIDAAMTAELGFCLTDFLAVIRETRVLGESRGQAVVTMPLREFVDTLSRELSWNVGKVKGILDALSLSPRKEFLQPPKPFRKEDVFPWRYNRSFSYIRRPLLQRQRNGVDEVIWGPRLLFISARHLISLLLSGRFPARSPQMKELMSGVNSDRGENFNDEVAKLFEESSGFIVRKRVKKIRDPNGWLRIPGDIDVLVAEPLKRRLLVAECKNLALGRGPHELRNELDSLFEGHPGKPAAIERHEIRVEWIRKHLAEVLSWLRLEVTGSRWCVDSLVVVNRELITPHLTKSKTQVLSYAELRAQLVAS